MNEIIVKVQDLEIVPINEQIFIQAKDSRNEPVLIDASLLATKDDLANAATFIVIPSGQTIPPSSRRKNSLYFQVSGETPTVDYLVSPHFGLLVVEEGSYGTQGGPTLRVSANAGIRL